MHPIADLYLLLLAQAPAGSLDPMDLEIIQDALDAAPNGAELQHAITALRCVEADLRTDGRLTPADQLADVLTPHEREVVVRQRRERFYVVGAPRRARAKKYDSVTSIMILRPSVAD